MFINDVMLRCFWLYHASLVIQKAFLVTVCKVSSVTNLKQNSLKLQQVDTFMSALWEMAEER